MRSGRSTARSSWRGRTSSQPVTGPDPPGPQPREARGGNGAGPQFKSNPNGISDNNRMVHHPTRPPDANGRPFLSVVIPAYNEEERIGDTLRQLVKYLGAQGYGWEIVVADDGSTDRTADLVRGAGAETAGIEMVTLPHGGKGWAVRHGMLYAGGEYRFLCDADISMPVEQISRFLPPALDDFDLAIGSREVPGARRLGEPYRRHLMGRVYNALTRALATPGVADTQCGFKCFRGTVADELFQLQRLRGFAFDVEVLFLARKRSLRVLEVPIDWYYRPASKVRPVIDSLAMTRDILNIRWHSLRGRYSAKAAHSEGGLVSTRGRGHRSE